MAPDQSVWRCPGGSCRSDRIRAGVPRSTSLQLSRSTILAYQPPASRCQRLVLIHMWLVIHAAEENICAPTRSSRATTADHAFVEYAQCRVLFVMLCQQLKSPSLHAWSTLESPSPT